ncbi:hypothetical protein [Nostoc sp. DSM 114161]|uniref:hypothetical protein n=1 Tax=Nostoc sp. DSM 114161 TaxID=3440143 RepID=UPI00404577A6
MLLIYDRFFVRLLLLCKRLYIAAIKRAMPAAGYLRISILFTISVLLGAIAFPGLWKYRAR